MKLEKIYHKGHRNAWDGKRVLDGLVFKHRFKIDKRSELLGKEREAIIRILSVILEGERIAWRTSSLLAYELEDTGSKMAATSQAHDEARHFYVLRDYMKQVLEHNPSSIDIAPEARRGLEIVDKAPTLAAKLLGMQLLVEPVAITLFRQLRKINVEPVLVDLLPYYEKDEARHIALGVVALPAIIEKMSWLSIIRLCLWQIKVLRAEARGLRSMTPYLEVLEIDPLSVFKEAEMRQIFAVKEMEENLALKVPLSRLISLAFAYERHLIIHKNLFGLIKSKIKNDS